MLIELINECITHNSKAKHISSWSIYFRHICIFLNTYFQNELDS